MLKTEASLALPGYSSVRIRGITSSPAGVLAVNASLSDPRLGSASAIVWIAPGGEILRVVGTSPFAASGIAFSADGSLWALGRVHDANDRNAPRYDMLRQYNAQGELVRTALASDAFGPQPLRTSEALLSVAGERILIYFRSERMFAEVSTNGSLVGRWKVDPFPAIEVTGAALASSGEIYATAVPARRETTADQVSLLYRLDRPSGRLVPLDAGQLAPPGTFAMLLGSDPDALVFYSRMPRMLSWVRAR